jgi:hypothetical protein
MSFGRKWREWRRYVKLGNNLVAVLKPQYDLLAPIGKSVEADGHINLKALAYVAGFANEALSSHHLDQATA